MAIKDNKSNTDVVILFNEVITADGTFTTTGFDGADYANGITFVPQLVEAGCTIEIINIQDSPDNSTWSNVDAIQIIEELPTISAPYNDLDIEDSFGVVGTHRYVRLEYTVSGYTQDALCFITINAGPEVRPEDYSAQNLAFENYIDSNDDFYVDINNDNYGAI